MYQLIYKSVRAASLSDDVFRDIADNSTKRNHALGLSGVLLADETTLVQILEGEEAVVRNLFARIQTDPRHVDVELLLERQCSERMFPRFGMGFYKSDQEDGSGFRMTLNALRAHHANRARSVRLAG